MIELLLVIATTCGGGTNLHGVTFYGVTTCQTHLLRCMGKYKVHSGKTYEKYVKCINIMHKVIEPLEEGKL